MGFELKEGRSYLARIDGKIEFDIIDIRWVKFTRGNTLLKFADHSRTRIVNRSSLKIICELTNQRACSQIEDSIQIQIYNDRILSVNLDPSSLELLPFSDGVHPFESLAGYLNAVKDNSVKIKISDGNRSPKILELNRILLEIAAELEEEIGGVEQ